MKLFDTKPASFNFKSEIGSFEEGCFERIRTPESFFDYNEAVIIAGKWIFSLGCG